jgi:hypothetical protein
MTPKQIIDRLEDIERAWLFDNDYTRRVKIERLRLDLEVDERKRAEATA